MLGDTGGQKLSDVRMKRNAEVSLPRLHRPTGGPTDEKEEAIHYLRPLRDSALHSRTSRHRGLRALARTRQQGGPLEQAQGDGAALPREVLGVWLPLLDRAGARQDEHV